MSNMIAVLFPSRTASPFVPARLTGPAKSDRNRLIALYVSMAIGLLVPAGLFLYEARIIVEEGLRDEAAFAVVGTANRVLHDVENAGTGQRGYLLTGDESYLLPYRQGIRDLNDGMLRLHDIARGNAKFMEVVRRAQEAKAGKVTELARAIELARAGNRAPAIALVQANEGKRYMDGLRRDLGLLLGDWRDRRRLAAEDARHRLVSGSAALGAVAILLCCLMG
jgi:CHASE3 domain sensor protein